MKLTAEEMKHYYASQGITREDLVSAAPITLAELPPDVQLTTQEQGALLSQVKMWNGLDDLAKVDAAQYSERRVLKQRVAVRSEAWAAVLFLGRVRSCEQRREVMQKIARGEMTPAEARPRKRARKAVPASDEPSQGAAFAENARAGVRTKGSRGVAREVEGGSVITIHHRRVARG